MPGHQIFEHNCAHCHGDDASGGEGPDLRNLTKSDSRISAIIKQGIKGEMPAFGKKLTDSDIHALIAYLRTLKD
jgi:mono/diheme cytochrome c family protein